MPEENIEEYQNRIRELEKQLEEATKDNSLDEIKQQYQKLIEDKDKEIKELQATVENNNEKIDQTVNDLNQEVKEKLEQTEAYKELQATVAQLEKERAEATVDAYIQKGILIPAQKDSAVKLCLNDNETFLNLYRDAKPIVDTTNTRKSIPTGTAERIANYFKN
jgi:predicted RNase H-like nuclease (RuvC/YqgF family)